jgi:hypothetical protein
VEADCSQLNTSRLGYEVFNTTETSSNPVVSFFKNITNTVEGQIQDKFNSFAQELGLDDFYQAHLHTYCEGDYVPGPVPNATLSSSSISKNVTSCSNTTGLFSEDLSTVLQRELNNSGHSNINIKDLGWPSAIDEGYRALGVTARATFVLYCIGVGLIGIAALLALISVFFDGRISALANVIVEVLAFLVIGIASAIATSLAVKGSDIVNKYGNRVGVTASQGNKWLAMTWVATGVVLVASILWCYSCCAGRKSRKTVHDKREDY